MRAFVSSGTACLAAGMLAGCAATTPEPDLAASERLICRTERPTGSHIPQRICHTAVEWQVMEEEARELMRRRGTQGSGCATRECQGQ